MNAFIALLWLSAAADTSPSKLDENGSEVFLSETRAAVACADRFLAGPDAEIGTRYLVRNIAPLMGTTKLPEKEPSQTDDEKKADSRGDACANLTPVGTPARKAVSTYIEDAIVQRAMAELLRAASIDVAELDRLAASDLETEITQATGQRKAFVALRNRLRRPELSDRYANAIVGYLVGERGNRVISEALHPPAHPARHTDGAITDKDYPAAALDRRKGGDTLVGVRVSAAGSIEQCKVMFSSGMELLDQTACQLISARFRYTPARDEQDHPVAQTVFQRIRWRLR